MTHYMRSGNQYNVAPDAAIDITSTLPVGNYAVRFDEFKGIFYLECIDSFSLPPKLYGDTTKNVERILSTFDARPAATGVLLTGEKGSGKTLLSKALSIGAGEIGIPTIVVNQPHFGDTFNTFMQSIEQPVVVLFDEFEKVYTSEQQEKMLTLLDGVYPSRKLFVLTVNDKWRVDSHMRNRPGRLFYNIAYGGLDSKFIEEYCEDVLDDKSHIPAIKRVGMVFDAFNFDMLKALVEEMNRYGESPEDAMRLLNAKPEYSEASKYKIALTKGGQPIRTMKEEVKLNPIVQAFMLYALNEKIEDDPWQEVEFSPENIKSMDAKAGTFTFETKTGYVLELTRQITEATYNYHSF